MSTTINEQNALQIRKSMEVYCGLSARTSNNLTFSATGDIEAKDTNISASLDHEHWDMRQLTDLSGDGFKLDGSAKWFDSSIAGSEEGGKIGLRTSIGGTVNVVVSSANEIAAVTLAITEGTGTITANGVDYDIGRIVVIPVNAKSITLTVVSDDTDSRVSIASITPGVNISFNNENLISCQLGLRSDLSIEAPTWEVSDIEIKAYWPDDISEAISNVGDDVPIWYYAGYEGDYSPTRQFYLSEAATMEENVLTIKGEDSSSNLDNKEYGVRFLNTTSLNGRRLVYQRMSNAITDAGVKLISRQASPAKGSGTAEKHSLIFKEHTSRDVVADIMNLAHYSTFWPVFVDAGRPVLRWSKPTSKWDIYEEDCGDVVRAVQRNIAKIKSADKTYGLVTKVTRKTKLQNLATRNVDADKRYSYTDDDFFWYLNVTNARDKIITPQKISWEAKKDTTTQKYKDKNGKSKTKTINQCKVTGKIAKVSTVTKSMTDTDKRPGVTAEMSTLVYGRAWQGDASIYPRYLSLFSRSNITGSFKWKGDPRMQPRDVFTFHRLDGSTEVCTIECITLVHEGGGTSAEITYRKGIV